MFRRSFLRVSGQQFRQQSDKESDRIFRERRRQILYDAAGNLQLGGLMYMLWEDFHKPVLCVLGALGFLYGYNLLVVKLSKDDEAHAMEFDKKSEELARQSGKLKSDRFLVKPNRQIDDPDFLNIPSYAGKGVFKSQLLEEDAVSGGPLQSEWKRS